MAGGFGGGYLDTTETLDYTTPGSAWTMMPARLPSAHRALRGLTMANSCYVMGGFANGNLKDVLTWNVTTKAWEEQSPLSGERRHPAVVSVPFAAIADWCI